MQAHILQMSRRQWLSGPLNRKSITHTLPLQSPQISVWIQAGNWARVYRESSRKFCRLASPAAAHPQPRMGHSAEYEEATSAAGNRGPSHRVRSWNRCGPAAASSGTERRRSAQTGTLHTNKTDENSSTGRKQSGRESLSEGGGQTRTNVCDFGRAGQRNRLVRARRRGQERGVLLGVRRRVCVKNQFEAGKAITSQSRQSQGKTGINQISPEQAAQTLKEWKQCDKIKGTDRCPCRRAGTRPRS